MRTVDDPSSLTLIITADPATKANDVFSVLRNDLPESNDKPKKVEIGGQTFWRAKDSSKPEPQQTQTVEYAGLVRGYAIRIVATGRGGVPAILTEAIEAASFLDPGAVSAARTGDMTEYAGPALPELGEPTEAMARLQLGSIDGNHYRNDNLGVDFLVPAGLTIDAQQKLEADRRPEDLPSRRKDVIEKYAEVERQIAQTCTRTLLAAGDGVRHSDGHIGLRVTLLAIDRMCVGGVRFPASTKEIRNLQVVASLVAQRVRNLHATEMKARVYSLAGHVMVNLSGILYGADPGTGLRIPNRVRLIATELHGYWVVWTFIAPDARALDRLSNTSVDFYPSHTGSKRQENQNDGVRTELPFTSSF